MSWRIWVSYSNPHETTIYFKTSQWHHVALKIPTNTQLCIFFCGFVSKICPSALLQNANKGLLMQMCGAPGGDDRCCWSDCRQRRWSLGWFLLMWDSTEPASSQTEEKTDKKEELVMCQVWYNLQAIIWRYCVCVCVYLFYWTSSLLGPTLQISWEDSVDWVLHAWISRFLFRSPTPLLACTFG